MTGKGKSRAGILSVKHLIESSFEIGSALYSITQANFHQWNIAIIDPNVHGANCAMNTTRKSLDRLFSCYFLDWETPIYIHAHSASGGHLVRYLSSIWKNSNSNNNQHQKSILFPIHQIQALAFTDSTHNIQWVRDQPKLFELLQSNKCLYLKNCAEHPSDTFANTRDKKAGEVVLENEKTTYWRRRFGNIKTLYAGTTDHSYMSYASRYVIWAFFDSFGNANK